MAKYKIVNKNAFDVVIDPVGNNSIKDKMILHPRNTVIVDVMPKAKAAIKSNKNLIVQPVK